MIKAGYTLLVLSMGGMGVYDMVCRFPDLFAAAVSICGSVNVQRLPKAKEVCFRIFHGEKDTAVPVECSRQAYEVLKDAVLKSNILNSMDVIIFPGIRLLIFLILWIGYLRSRSKL